METGTWSARYGGLFITLPERSSRENKCRGSEAAEHKPQQGGERCVLISTGVHLQAATCSSLLVSQGRAKLRAPLDGNSKTSVSLKDISAESNISAQSQIEKGSDSSHSHLLPPPSCRVPCSSVSGCGEANRQLSSSWTCGPSAQSEEPASEPAELRQQAARHTPHWYGYGPVCCVSERQSEGAERFWSSL